MQSISGFAGGEHARDGAHKLMHGGVGFHLHHLWDVNAARAANAGEIIAREVDNHEIFGAVLFARSQRGAESGVFLWIAVSPACSLDGPRFHVTRAVDAQESLGRGAGDVDIVQMQISREGRGILLA